MVDYAKLKLTAQRLIENAGREVDIVRLQRTPDSLTKPWRGGATPRDDDEIEDIIEGVKVVFVEPSSLVRFGIEIKDDNAQGRHIDKICLVATESIADAELNEYDELRDGGTSYHIWLVRHLEPGPVRLFTVLGMSR